MSTNYVGSFTSQVIRDTRGRTDNNVAGSFNNLTYVGDKGANTFRVGGQGNNVNIRNIGRDESIQLEGNARDWVQMPDANCRDGQVTMFNRVTGNTVTMATDAGRNDDFVKSKVSFTGCYSNPAHNAISAFGGWQNVGNLAFSPHCFNSSSYMAGYLAGRADGRAQGYVNGWANGAAWGTWASLPYRAWGRCF